MATVTTFDTLAYTKALIARGFEQKHAEALAETNQEFFVHDLATKEFVHTENKAIREEIKMSELRIQSTLGKTMIACTGILLAGIPIVQVLLQRLS